MLQNIEACEWLAAGLQGLQVPPLDSTFAKMRAVCTLSSTVPYQLNEKVDC